MFLFQKIRANFIEVGWIKLQPITSFETKQTLETFWFVFKSILEKAFELSRLLQIIFVN